MRILLSTLIILLSFGVTFSQKKPKVSKGVTYMEEGNLQEAKVIFDAAIEYEKTKNKGKTWFYRGQLYVALDTSENLEGALETALESFDKALELDPKQSFSVPDFTSPLGVKNIDSELQKYEVYYLAQGVTFYQDEEFLKAADNFETAYKINPQDSNAILNAAYAASNGGDNERGKKNFLVCYELGMEDKNVYLQLYNYALQEDNFDDALTYVREAKKIFTDDKDLPKYEINILLQTDQLDEAKSEIIGAIEREPDNSDLYFSLGIIYEESKELAQAEENYQKALAADPEHYNSAFNLGVLIYNKANELIKKRNALSWKEEKKIAKYDKQIREQLNIALPYWEKLYELKDDEKDVLETLKYIYTFLRMNDKALEMTEKLEKL